MCYLKQRKVGDVRYFYILCHKLVYIYKSRARLAYVLRNRLELRNPPGHYIQFHSCINLFYCHQIHLHFHAVHPHNTQLRIKVENAHWETFVDHYFLSRFRQWVFHYALQMAQLHSPGFGSQLRISFPPKCTRE